MPLSKTRSSKRQSAAPPMSVPNNSKGSMAESVKQGFGLGVGLEAARAAVSGVTNMMSSNDSQPSNITSSSENSCKSILKALETCQNETPNDCKPLIDLLKKCSS